MRRVLLVVGLLAAAVLVPAGPAHAACSFTIPNQPGTSETKGCVISNTGSSDFTAYWGVAPGSIVIKDAQGRKVGESEPRWEQFAGYYRYSVSTERFVTTKNPTGQADIDVARVPHPAYNPVCVDRELTSFDGSTGKMCRIGRVRGGGRQFSSRSFEVTVRMLVGPDQDQFFGWTLNFSETVRICGGSRCPSLGTDTPVDEL